MDNRFDLKNDISFFSRQEIHAVQNRLLTEHIRYCRNHSPFYKKLLAGFPDREYTFDSLQDLPITEKKDLAEHNYEFFAVPDEQFSDICFTSGTTGVPCQIAYTESDMRRLRYNEGVGFRSVGVNPSDKALLTCTMDRCFIAGMAYMNGAQQNGAAIIRSGLNSMEGHADIISMVHPSVLIGVPSFLVKLGDYLNKNHVDYHCFKKLICIGESLRNRDLQLTAIGKQLDELWPNAAHSTYAATETIVGFTECHETRCGGHPPADLVIAEVLDDNGNRVPDGEPGELTLTPLQVTGMPLIRFRTGDITFILPEPCPCGRGSIRIGPILGRKAQMLKMHGTTIYPGAFFNVLDSIPEISEYYMEVRGSAQSDEIAVFAACRPGYTVESLNIAGLLRGRVRIHVPVIQVSEEKAMHQVYGISRKPKRFFDYRTM